MKSSIHGRGVFATCRIPKGTLIGKYEGPWTKRDGAYVLWIEKNDGTPIGMRGTNSLRFVNHSSKPNAAFYAEELVALRSIAPGEEITFHYGDEWDDVP